MTCKWLFVDEHPEEARRCVDLLREPGSFEVELIAPEEDVTFLGQSLAGRTFDGLLLDHALNDARAEIKYTGSTLAAFVRTEYPKLPVVALSAKLKEKTELRRYRRTEDLFDWKLDKQDLQTKVAIIRRDLTAISQGYRRLTDVLSGEHEDTLAAACDVLGIQHELEDNTERAAVARLLLETASGGPARVAHFLLHVALRLPGPLLKRRRAAVAAGIDPSPNAATDEHIAPAIYEGVFASLDEGSWYWREKLTELETRPPGLAAANCVVCSEEAFEVCEVCAKPVDGLHSLPVHRNEVANDVFLRGRVCGFCLGGELPPHLVIDGRYAEMREVLVAQAQELQSQQRRPSARNSRRL